MGSDRSPAPGAVGLIGLGEIGQVHAAAVRQSSAARLVAVADTVPDLLAPFQALGIRGYRDASELIAEGDQVDHWNLGWTGKGRIKDDQRPVSASGRQIRLTGSAHDSEVRVHRGGIAILSAMFSRAFVQDARQARRNGTYPTIDDPTRAIR